jgi:hypothetical protein
MAPPKRPTKPHRLEIRLEPEQYEAIKQFLKRRPDLGDNPTGFGRKRILEALERPPPRRNNDSPVFLEVRPHYRAQHPRQMPWSFFLRPSSAFFIASSAEFPFWTPCTPWAVGCR